jgi:hypothetical protein
MFMIKRQSHKAKGQSSEPAEQKQKTWKDVLLGDGPRFDLPIPKRGNRKTCQKLEPGENPYP